MNSYKSKFYIKELSVAVKKICIDGIVEVNPFGNWSDVDKGVFVGGERMFSYDFVGAHIFDDYDLVGKNIRITIEVVEDGEDA